MKKLTILLGCMAVVFGIVGTAHTTPYTWTDSKNWNPAEYIKTFGSFSYEHNISDDADGFVPGEDLIYRYSIKVALHDDGGCWDSGELAKIDQPGLIGDGIYNFGWTSQTYGWSLAGLIDINMDGTLNLIVRSIFGDFYLDSSYLTAEGFKCSVSVPEPETMLMLGSVLLGLVAVSRKRFNHRN